MARMFNFRSFLGDMVPNAISKTSSLTLNLAVIDAYNKKISNYEHNKSVLNSAIELIDQTVSELTSVNELIDNVKINKEKYDKGKLEDIIGRLNTIRSNFESFVIKCNNEIERLENELSSIKNSGGE